MTGSTDTDGHKFDLAVSWATDDIIMSYKVGDFTSDHNGIDMSMKAGSPYSV